MRCLSLSLSFSLSLSLWPRSAKGVRAHDDGVAGWRVNSTSTSAQMCDATHSYVWRDTFICATWRIHVSDMGWRIENTWTAAQMCDVTHSYVWRDIFTCVTWCTHMCDMGSRVENTRTSAQGCVPLCDVTRLDMRCAVFKFLKCVCVCGMKCVCVCVMWSKLYNCVP